MPQEFLHGTDVMVVLQEVGRERMTQGMRTGPLRNAGLRHRVLDLALEDGLVQVMTPSLPGGAVDDMRVAGKTHCQTHCRPA
jgi:hypothetical protein